MSSGYWQMKRQGEQSPFGKGIIWRVENYIKTWKNRYYSNGIPEEVPHKVMKVNAAPSYKAIAIAILKNDITLKSLGYYIDETELSKLLMKSKKETKQIDLFRNVQ